MHLAAYGITCLASDTHHLLSSGFPETLFMLPGCGRKLACLGSYLHSCNCDAERGQTECSFQTRNVLCPLSSTECSGSRKTWISHAWVELRGRIQWLSSGVILMCSGLSGAAVPAGGWINWELHPCIEVQQELCCTLIWEIMVSLIRTFPSLRWVWKVPGFGCPFMNSYRAELWLRIILNNLKCLCISSKSLGWALLFLSVGGVLSRQVRNWVWFYF